MFLLNIGYRWVNHDNANGVIISASGLHTEQMVRRNLGSQPEMLLFDPQLYLSGLDCDDCGMTCARLSTYPWYGGSEVEYDSDTLSQRDWFAQHKESMNWPYVLPETEDDIEDCIKECFDYQINIGVTHLIIPVPLVENIEDEFKEQLLWIDVALKLKENYDLPMLGSIPFIDQLMFHQDPMENRIAQSIIDNLSVRTELDGIYVLPVQTVDNTTRIDNKRVAEFLLHISNIIGYDNEKIVVVNYADVFGYTCLSAGATAFGGGYTNRSKRLNFSDFFERDGGGPAYPKFYSHKLVLDLLTNRDLTKLQEERLLRLISKDATRSSEDLFNALNDGEEPNSIPTWRESPNNVSVAAVHRIERLVNATEELMRIDDNNEKEDYVLGWLQDAEAYTLMLRGRFSGSPLSDDGRHIAVWRSAFENYLDNR